MSKALPKTSLKLRGAWPLVVILEENETVDQTEETDAAAEDEQSF